MGTGFALEAINTRPNISPILLPPITDQLKKSRLLSRIQNFAYDGDTCRERTISERARLAADAKGLVPILESYLEQRGVALPEGYLSAKVICPNPNFSTIHSVSFPPEVVTYDQWMQLTPKYKNKLSGWVKGAFRGWKKEFQESIYEKLNFILSYVARTLHFCRRTRVRHDTTRVWVRNSCRIRSLEIGYFDRNS